ADSTCYNGFATPISFSLVGTLPDTVIVTLAYNTTDYGYQPIGPSTCSATPAGCGYDSLNVGLVNSIPAVGTNPVPNSDYLNSTWTGAYCDNGVNGIGTLRFDTGSAGVDPACPYQPALSVSASPAGVRVQIFKYVDGVQATAANANSATFPMLTSWTSPNLGSPSNVPFTLSPSPWGGIGIPYEADFVGSVAGADYTASEVTTGNNVVGATCAAGNPFALQGYTMGDNLAQAQGATKTLTAPQFTNLQSDHVMIVWNVKCPPAPVHPTTKDQCKDNGWQTLADINNRPFKNQGDCVSYVATNGKNKANG
ncbi:MAG TPA: hypothetical protein VLE69_01325, partial [Candidatus Saccharimonadales bacterium]|nr:hypothetical protein [Candidatus Saccharimonadales bacterium]